MRLRKKRFPDYESKEMPFFRKIGYMLGLGFDSHTPLIPPIRYRNNIKWCPMEPMR